MSDVSHPIPPGHAFLCYVREDTSRADRLQAVLEAAGVTVWRDISDLWPGTDWRLHIRAAITDGSLAFVACFSEHSSARTKSYQNEELILAVEQMRLRPPGVEWLLPVRFADCDIPPFELGAGRRLDSLQCVDLFDDHWERGGPRLVGAVMRILAAQQAVSPARYGDPPSSASPPAASLVPPVANTLERQMLLAQLSFLGKLKPRLLWHTGGQAYDQHSVDLFLMTMRSLAMRGMTELQAFVGTTPRAFPSSRNGGYFSASVQNFFSRTDRAMKEYAEDTRKPPSRMARIRRNDAGQWRQLTAAQSKFLSQLKANLLDAENRTGYDRASVDQFLSDLRSFASGDIVRLQIFLATSPGTFPQVPEGGYFGASVDNFMTRLHSAMADYVLAVSKAI